MNAEIAKAVARALGLKYVESPAHRTWAWWGEDDQCYLKADGSNLTDPYWRCRSLDWLLGQGYALFIKESGVHELWPRNDGKPEIDIHECPADEFPARAIAALMEKQT